MCNLTIETSRLSTKPREWKKWKKWKKWKRKKRSALMRDSEGVLTEKKKASTCVFCLQPLYGLISKGSRRLNERQTYRDNSLGDTKDASVSNKTSGPLSTVCCC